jgi:hypothetical protein
MRTVDVWAQITTERMASRPWLETLMRWTGRSGGMFGTNWPMLSPPKCLEGLSGLGLSEEQSQMFLSGNACRIFNL